MTHPTFGLLAVMISVGLSGCSREKLDELASKTKAATSDATKQLRDATESIREQTDSVVQSSKEVIVDTSKSIADAMPGSGEITLQTDPPIQTSIGRWTVHRVEDGSSKSTNFVWEATSYRTDEPIQTYPAVMMRAVIPWQDAAPVDPTGTFLPQRFFAPLDNTILVQLFVQQSAQAAVWASVPDAPVQIRAMQVDDSGQLTGRLAPASLQSTDGTTVTLQGGNLALKWIEPLGSMTSPASVTVAP